MFCLLLNQTPTSAKNRLTLWAQTSLSCFCIPPHISALPVRTAGRKRINHDAESEETRNIYPRRRDKVHSQMQTGVCFLKTLFLKEAKTNFTCLHRQNGSFMANTKHMQLWQLILFKFSHNLCPTITLLRLLIGCVFLCVVNHAPEHVLFWWACESRTAGWGGDVTRTLSPSGADIIVQTDLELQ